MPRAKSWKIEIDFGNCERYICPYCNEENDWESPHCPMCGRKLRSSEEIEEAKGLELRKDIPECMCIQDDCMFNHAGVCSCPPSPYELWCSRYVSRGTEL